MKYLGIIQARCSSTRLPGKVLKKILDKPMLQLLIERVQESKELNQIVVATSNHESDLPIVQLCKKIKVECFQGNLNNVLDRFYEAALRFKGDHIVRLTGDCPLLDPEVIDDVIQFYKNGNFDYASNTIHPTFPDGLDTEVFSMKLLEEARELASDSIETEHVTQYFIRRPKKFKLGNFVCSNNLANLRFTVDEMEDFIFVREVYNALYSDNPNFKLSDILGFLASNPELYKINSHFQRNEGLLKQLEKTVGA